MAKSTGPPYNRGLKQGFPVDLPFNQPGELVIIIIIDNSMVKPTPANIG